MDGAALPSTMTRAEDRALLRSNPSADPGAEPDRGGRKPPPPSASIRLGTNALNLRGTMPRSPGRMPAARKTSTAKNSGSR